MGKLLYFPGCEPKDEPEEVPPDPLEAFMDLFDDVVVDESSLDGEADEV